jgi:hypothetical protein
MVLIRSDSCSRVLGIPHPAAPPPLATRSRERSNDQANCFDRGQRTIGRCRQLGCSGSYWLLAASNFQRSVYAAISAAENQTKVRQILAMKIKDPEFLPGLLFSKVVPVQSFR